MTPARKMKAIMSQSPGFEASQPAPVRGDKSATQDARLAPQLLLTVRVVYSRSTPPPVERCKVPLFRRAGGVQTRPSTEAVGPWLEAIHRRLAEVEKS